MRSSRFAAATLCSMMAAGTMMAMTGTANADTELSAAGAWDRCGRTGYSLENATTPGDITTSIVDMLTERCGGGGFASN